MVADKIFELTDSQVIPVSLAWLGAIAYTLQIVGQKYSEATVASLIMSLESLFCMVAACVFYAKLPTLREGIGCVIMLFAIFVVETPFADRIYAKIFKKKANE